MVIDLGAMINVIGANTEKDFTEAANSHGHETMYLPKTTRLQIRGLTGGPSTTSALEAQIPIAVKTMENEATKDVFRPNLATGGGEDMPAILGLGDISARDGVIILRAEHEMIAFPGPGGYQIQWSPDTKLLPLSRAQTGHLLLPCDHFDQLPIREGLDPCTQCTDHRRFATAEMRKRPSNAQPKKQFAGFNSLNWEEIRSREDAWKQLCNQRSAQAASSRTDSDPSLYRHFQ